MMIACCVLAVPIYLLLGAVVTGLVYRAWGDPEDIESLGIAVLFWPVFLLLLIGWLLIVAIEAIVNRVGGLR